MFYNLFLPVKRLDGLGIGLVKNVHLTLYTGFIDTFFLTNNVGPLVDSLHNSPTVIWQ